MSFDATPTNMTEILVVVLAVFAVMSLLRKRYDSNLPLLFYFVALIFTNMADRPVDPYLMYGSMAFALILRFEFMNVRMAKVIGFMASAGLCVVIYQMMTDVLG
jgi:hypothetical protein